MFNNVIVGVDGRQGGRDAIALARQLAGPDAAMTLAHIYGVGVMRGRGAALLRASELVESHRLLEHERDLASLDAQLVPSAERSVGRGLQRLAADQASDLLMLGSCRRSPLGRALVGDDASSALNGAPCAVAIAPSGYAIRADELLSVGIGYDGSPESDRALAVARALAANHGSAIKAMAVVSLQSIPYGEPIDDNLPEVAKRLVNDERRHLSGLGDIEGDATFGEPGDELATFSAELDLLIVGSRSYGPMGRLMNGSTSNYLARRAHCPLLVLPRSASPGEERAA